MPARQKKNNEAGPAAFDWGVYDAGNGYATSVAPCGQVIVYRKGIHKFACGGCVDPGWKDFKCNGCGFTFFGAMGVGSHPIWITRHPRNVCRQTDAETHGDEVKETQKQPGVTFDDGTMIKEGFIPAWYFGLGFAIQHFNTREIRYFDEQYRKDWPKMDRICQITPREKVYRDKWICEFFCTDCGKKRRIKAYEEMLKKIFQEITIYEVNVGGLMCIAGVFAEFM